jgi:hypothetical protein
MIESLGQFVGMLFILLFLVWGIAGFVASFRNKERSNLRNWWRGSRYGSLGEPDAGPILSPGIKRDEGRR